MNEQSREATEIGSERTSARNADLSATETSWRCDNPTREAEG